MKSQHGITVIRISAAHLHDGVTRSQVDTRNTDGAYASLTGTGDNGFEVVPELLAVKMAVGINESHQL
jgi:hypothetical protein